eukprot:5988103-Pyramimonas_sp.AAC.1
MASPLCLAMTPNRKTATNRLSQDLLTTCCSQALGERRDAAEPIRTSSPVGYPAPAASAPAPPPLPP